MTKIGVIGAGVMGSGVAQNFAQVGYEVFLLDISDDILKDSSQKIYDNVRLQKLISTGIQIDEPEQILSRIRFTKDYNILKDVDFIVENVPEIWETKKNVYTMINDICQENCIFLVNTSCISITRVASLVRNPERVIGVHFMNPVPLKKTVEVIRAHHTSQKTIDATKILLESMGKTCVVVNDYPGFVSNRISHLFMNEAAFVVQDNIASPEEVDLIFKECYGHKMGPLETADLIGIDTVVNSLDILYESYHDSKFRCCPLLRKMVYAGLLGRKSGKGFYTYENY